MLLERKRQRSSTKVVLPENENPAVPVLKLYYQRTKIQPAAGDGRSSTRVVLPENENPADRRGRPYQYSSCTTRERKSSQPPATAVPVLKLYYQRTKIQPAAADGRSSTKVVLPENENPASRQPAAADGRSSTRVLLPENENPAGRCRRPPALKLYYQRTKIQPAAADGRSSTRVLLPENENPASRQPAAGDGRSSTQVVLPENENPAGRCRRPFQY